MKTVSLLAQFPPPIHGLSKAVETLYQSHLSEKYGFQKIDITNNKRIIHNICSIIKAKCDCFYFTISQTKGGNWRDLLFLQLIAWKKKKCIIHLHGGYYRQLLEKDCGKWQRWLNIKALGRIDAAIVLGDSLKGIFEGWVEQKKIFVVPNCVDNLFMSSSIEDKMDRLQTQDKIHLLYLSNFIASKGYREVLEIARYMKEHGMQGDYLFHFAGKFFQQEEKDFFFSYIDKYSLKEVVEYHGVVSGDAKNELLRLCNIFLLLTRYPNEGQPISILEAMENGMAVVTTDHAGIPDIANQNNGLVCSKNNILVKDIAEYLEDGYCNRNALIDTCVKNHRTVKDKYTESQYLNNLDRVFQEVLTENN